MFINARQGEVAAAEVPQGKSSGAGAKTEHAGILFSLGDFLEWFGPWARPTLRGRTTDILVVLAAIFWSFRGAHGGDLDVGSFLLEVGPPGLA